MSIENDVTPHQETQENPHVLWQQIIGFIFWNGLIGYLSGGIQIAAATLIVGVFAFADSWSSGMWKTPNRKGFLNISPMSWGIAMGLLFIVAFPAYVFYRNKLARPDASNGLFTAMIIVGSIVTAFVVHDFYIAFTVE